MRLQVHVANILQAVANIGIIIVLLLCLFKLEFRIFGKYLVEFPAYFNQVRSGLRVRQASGVATGNTRKQAICIARRPRKLRAR